MAKSNAVLSPNMGLYYDRPKFTIPSRALSDGLNFRVQNGKLNNLNLGWDRFETFVLNGPVLLIEDFFPTAQGLPEQLVFGTQTDLYRYRAATHDVRFLTPRYQTGTAAASGTTVTGTGTLWTTAALHIRGGDQIHFGTANQTDPAALWYTIAGVPGSNTAITLTTSAGIIANGPYTIRRLFSGGTTTVWSTAAFTKAGGSTDQLWITNGVDPILYWDGAAASVQEEATGLVLPFKAKHVAVYDNMLIFANLIQSGAYLPTDMVNSNPGDPTNFTTGLAGQQRIHAGYDEIVGMDVLGDNLVLYSREHIITAQFVGSDVVWIFRAAGSYIGPAGQGSIANYGDYHEFVGRDTQYAFDGVTIREVNVHVWREILRQQDPVRITRLYNHFDQENGELIWSVPLTTDPQTGQAAGAPARAWTEHYLEQSETNARTVVPTNPFSSRQFPFLSTGYYSKQSGITWDTLTQPWSTLNFRWNDRALFTAFPLNLGGTSDGKVYTFNTSQNADGAALPSFVRFGKRALMEGTGRGLLARVYPFVEPFSNTLAVTSLMSDHAGGIPTITQIDTFDQSLPEGGSFVTPYRRGKYMEVQFGTSGPNAPYILGGYDVKIRPGGAR